MQPATDSASKRPARWPWVLLGLAVCSGDVGCARLRSFREDCRSVFGAPLASKADGKAARGGDLYAEQFHRAQNEAALARNEKSARSGTSAPEGEDEPATETVAQSGTESKPRSPIALQTPVPLPTAGGREAEVASRPAEPSWKAAEERDASTSADRTVAMSSGSARAREASTETRGPRVEALVAETRAKLDTMANYQVALNRQERVGGTLLPAEDVLLSIRRNPKAVRLEWPSGSHKGREVLYSASDNGGLMHVNMADSVVPVPRLSLPPESPLVLKNSRHPITEAGFDTVVQNLEQALRLSKVGDSSGEQVSYGGLEQPEGLDRPCHKVRRVTPTGETWLVYLDPETKLPAMVQANDKSGELLERYLFRDPRPNVDALAGADAFDPNRRWGEPKGLLSRLARPTDTATR